MVTTLSVFSRASLVAQRVKCLPAIRETQVWSLGWEDLLEKEMATYSSILACKIPRTEKPGRLQSTGSQRVGHDWATSLSVTQSCPTLGDPMDYSTQASPSITNSQCLLKFKFIKSVMPSNYLILCHPFLLLPSVFPSTRVFSNESVLRIRWPKYWSFSFSISPFGISYSFYFYYCCESYNKQLIPSQLLHH